MKLTPCAAPSLGHLLPHKFAMIFPEMDAPTFNSLTENMNTNGWDARHPIVLHKGLILDGRNRLRAAMQVKADPTFSEFIGTDEQALSFVITENLHRRHLTPSERAVIATELLELETVSDFRQKTENANGTITVSAEDKERKKGTLAVNLGISRKTIDRAIELKRLDRPAFDAIKNARLTMQRPGKEKSEKAPRNVSGALKKAKEAQAQKLPPPPPVAKRDDAGHAIHARAVNALGPARDYFSKIVRTIQALKRDVLALAKDTMGRAMDGRSVETDFDNLIRQIKDGTPYSSCPLNDPCGEGCKLCRGTQWITEQQYRGLPEIFRKRG